MSNDILAALNDIQGKLDNLTQSFRAQSCGCCGPSPENVSSESGTEGSTTPPIPFVWIEYGPSPTQPGSSQYYDRKCKAANRIHEDLVNYVTHLDSINIVSQSIDFMFAVLSSMLSITSSWPIIGTIASVISGWLISLQSAISETGVNLSGLISALNTNADELICALYNSTSASGALTAYTDILSAASVPPVDIAIVETILTPDVLNYLYFQNDGYVEAVLSGYTSPYACDCGNELIIQNLCGGLMGEITNQNGNVYDIQSVTRPYLLNDCQVGDDRPQVNATIVNPGNVQIELLSGTGQFYWSWLDTVGNPQNAGWQPASYFPQTIPLSNFHLINGDTPNGGTPFTIRVTLL